MTHILYNPKANCGRGAAVLDEIRKEMVGEYRAADLTTLQMGDYISALSEEDEVILCGGDGTLQHLVTDLSGRSWKAKLYLWRPAPAMIFYGMSHRMQKERSPSTTI